jgi:hypothetical protein
MRRAVVAGLLLAAFAVAPTDAATTPEICGADGCTSLPTATLVGLLTLPGALERAQAPGAQPFFVFAVTDLDGRSSDVVYVPGATGALLRFPGGGGWRRVPIDDAQLLRDAASTTTPYPASTSSPARVLFDAETRASAEPWPAIVGIVALAAIAVGAGLRWRSGAAAGKAGAGRPR